MAVSKVVVVDGNNLIVRIDRGVAGRGVTDVQPIEIDNQLFLEFTFSDGTTETVGPVGTIQYIGQSPIVINGPTISLSTVPINLGGTNATTAAGARTNLNAADQATTISAGTGLSGGGSLAANRTIDIANTTVTAGSYGSASNTLSATVNAQGQLTALAATPIAVANTQVSGLGTMSTQNANSVAITGGSVTGITDLAVLDGGTGASDASGARTNLGAAASATTITAGTGLSGGGDLSANRTLAIANTAVTAGSFGSASNTLTATVNAQGQLTALAATPIAIANTQVSGLGTASVLNAGVALGVATLDAGGTVPLSQIPASIQGGVSYQGSWNASTNTPTLVSSVGSKGYYYVVSVAGSTNLNGITDWLPGDWAIYNGTAWEKIDNTDTVASVNGYVGAVVLNAADVGAPPTTRSISTGTGLTGGGNLSADRTISIDNTAVSAGSYGSASAVPTLTVNAQGQLTAASNTTIAIANTQVSGLGTMSTQNANSVAITGGTINGTTVGATTPSTVTGTTVTATTLVVNDNSTLGSSNTDTVTFTARVNSDIDPSTDNTYDLGRNSHAWRNLYLTGTANIAALTASGAVTLSGGTANGVAYLNGSKVLTTGSALTFDGTRLTSTTARFGGGAASNSASLMVNNATNTATGIQLFQDGIESWIMGMPANSAGLAWSASGSEQMRLTSTGLGIGTSSPVERLDVRKTTSAILGMPITAVIGAPASEAVAAGSGGGIYFAGAFNGTESTLYAAISGEKENGTSGNTAGVLRFGVRRVSGGTNIEAMRLDSSGNLGIGSAPAATSGRSVDLDGVSLQPLFTMRASSLTSASTTWTLDNTNSLVTFDSSATWPFRWLINSAEQMRLTSTGLGIGTSSPSYKFQASGGKATTGIVGSFINVVSGGNSKIHFSDEITYNWTAGTTGNAFTISSGETSTIAGTERLRLDSSGNLGLGVTPSASWTSAGSQKALQVGSYAALSSSGTGAGGYYQTVLGMNCADHTTSTKYLNTGFATAYVQATGEHQWLTAPSGTAGNAISFSQVMTLAAGGQLGIGNTIPGTIDGNNGSGTLVVGTGSGSQGMTIYSGSSSGNEARLTFANSSSGAGAYAAQITYKSGDAAILFYNGNAERARIDSSGNFMVGTTTDQGARVAADASSGNAMWARTAAASSAVNITWNSATSGDNIFETFFTDGGPSNRGSITYNRAGGLVAYNVTSDYRAKDIIGPVTNSGALIDSVPVYVGKMKGATQERPMFIAHEVPAYAHTGEKDAVDAEGKPVYQQMDASALIPVMWAEIQSLRARLAAANI